MQKLVNKNQLNPNQKLLPITSSQTEFCSQNQFHQTVAKTNSNIQTETKHNNSMSKFTSTLQRDPTAWPIDSPASSTSSTK